MSLTLKTSPYWPYRPHPKQAFVLSLNHIDEILFGGQAGGGKSDVILFAASQYADLPHSHALIFRRTLQDLKLPGALLDRAKEWFIPQGVSYNGSDYKFTFPSGSTITFAYLQNETDHLRYQGAEVNFVGFDEASQIRSNQLEYIPSRLRSTVDIDIPKRIRYTSNPGGISHDWLKDRFITSPNTSKCAFVPSSLKDNPSLPYDEYREQLMKLDPVTREQLMNGDWDVIIDSGWMQVANIQVVEEMPFEPELIVRYWDMAGSKDGDYTVGAKVAYYQGQYCIMDIRRFRKLPAQVEQEVLKAAKSDGDEVMVKMEQEPGSSGKHSISHYSRNILQEYSFSGEKITGNKIERAKIVASGIANENVYMLKAPWNRDLTNELKSFPDPKMHDDQVDALSGAFRYLVRGTSY